MLDHAGSWLEPAQSHFALLLVLLLLLPLVTQREETAGNLGGIEVQVVHDEETAISAFRAGVLPAATFSATSSLVLVLWDAFKPYKSLLLSFCVACIWDMRLAILLLGSLYLTWKRTYPQGAPHLSACFKWVAANVCLTLCP